MYHEDGSFYQPFFFERPPIHAFIHTGIIANAPDRYLWAGMGDTYAKFYECTVSTRNDELEHFNALGVSMSRMCVDPILAYGEKALKDNQAHRSSYELEQVILAIQVTTALVSILVTTEHTVDNNSGLAHAIFYALTSIPAVEQNHLHGEIVGFGVLILLLIDKQFEEYETLYQFHKKVGLPVHISELDLTTDQLHSLLSTIVSMPDIRHNAYPITKEALWDAFEKNEKNG